MVLDILTVLFFVLGFALILCMVGKRRRDVLHGPYVTKSGTAPGDVSDDRIDRMATRKQRPQSRRLFFATPLHDRGRWRFPVDGPPSRNTKVEQRPRGPEYVSLKECPPKEVQDLSSM